MDLGEVEKTIVIEPIDIPVPGHKEPAPPEPEYTPEPEEPNVEAPPDLVPA